jgi:hypothetical protein
MAGCLTDDSGSHRVIQTGQSMPGSAGQDWVCAGQVAGRGSPTIGGGLSVPGASLWAVQILPKPTHNRAFCLRPPTATSIAHAAPPSPLFSSSKPPSLPAQSPSTLSLPTQYRIPSILPRLLISANHWVHAIVSSSYPVALSLFPRKAARAHRT